ncbi:hemicentin-1-like isoform X2 [Carassius carassius]|uniref:hemicentin-1-like isoform X2 n=1 Tax=Carassius carassius TaxID=217509 RepID=UPI002868DF38|nr:hemicentin-1-like isoform X2 [Carassius carassius]
MTCQHLLLFLFLSGFAALCVAEICKTDLLEGTSCTFKLKTENTDKSYEIKWIHLSSDAVVHRKNGRIKKPIPGLRMEEDGSLTFESVSLKNTGRYTYTVFNDVGTQLDAGEKEIKVYAKAPKPTVNINCTDGIATLTCDFRHRTDLTVSWYKEDNIIQNENNPNLLLTSAQVQENKPYSCSVSNPVSKEQSDSITVSSAEIYKTDLLEGTSCTIKLPTKNTDKSNEIKWVHLSSDAVVHRKNGKIRTNTPGLTIEEDGSLTFESVSLKNTGRYTYIVFNDVGTKIDAGEKEIKVYAKAPKPTVKINCTDGITTLTCDFGDRTDLTVSWYKEDNIIQNENNPNLLLTSAQVQENKPYSCSVSNPVSKEQSDSITVSFSEICKTELLEGTSCTIKLPTKNTDKSNEIKWVHLSGDAVVHRKGGKIRTNTPGLTIEEDGSLTFESVSLKNTGRYTYIVFNAEGTQIDAGGKEIKVYAKAPKPTVKINCTDGITTLTCDFRHRTDLTVSWYKEDNIIQNENNPNLLLTSAQAQENKPYSCSVSNPVSKEQSDSITVSFSEICKTELLEGTSCTIKLPTKNTDKSNEIKWVHLSGDAVVHRKGGKIRTNTPGLTIEEDGSLTFESVSLKNSGRYTYTVFNNEGTQIDAGEKEIKVYAKAPKPTVKINCTDGITTLTCDFGDRTDLTVSWYKEDNIIQNENNPNLLLTSAQVQENKPYSCSVSNPVSKEQSDRRRVSRFTGTTVKSELDPTTKVVPVPRTFFGFDFWIMVSILASSGALLLLLLCVLIICACRSCSQSKQQDEKEFRLRNLEAPAPTKTDSNTVETSDYN